MHKRAKSRELVLVAFLLVGDAVLLCAHFLHLVDVVDNPVSSRVEEVHSTKPWKHAGDGSFIEYFGQLQLASAAIILLRTSRQGPGRQVLGGWAFVLLVVTADDLFRLHEQLGALLVPAVGDFGVPPASAQEVGGLAVWILIGIPLGTMLVREHQKSEGGARHISSLIGYSLFPLIAVGLGYVVLSGLFPVILEKDVGYLAAGVRVTVKLIVMTLIFWIVIRCRSPHFFDRCISATAER